MKLIKKTRLTFVSGSSNKEYIVNMYQDGTKYEVRCQNGRIGSTLADAKNTGPTPVSKAEADNFFDKMVNEKIKKGYKVDRTASTSEVKVSISEEEVPSMSVEPKEQDATLVQLLKTIDSESDLEKFLNDDQYVLQEKKDGERRTVDKNSDGIKGGNKKGFSTNLPLTVVASLSEISDIELDGEIIGDKLFVFDILRLEGNDLWNEPYTERLKTLSDVKFGSFIEVVETVSGKQKAKSYKKLLEQSKLGTVEGVVFKKKDAPYNVGRDSDSAFKYKFYSTATVLVVDKNAGKRSVKVAVMEGKKKVEVGSVTIPANKPIPDSGALVEVRYLYAYKEGSLYQPTYIHERNDCDIEDAGISQLKYKDESAA